MQRFKKLSEDLLDFMLHRGDTSKNNQQKQTLASAKTIQCYIQPTLMFCIIPYHPYTQ